jgi:hypothetical protein
VALRAARAGRTPPRIPQVEAEETAEWPGGARLERTVVAAPGYHAALRARSLTPSGGFFYGAEPPTSDRVTVRMNTEGRDLVVPARVIRRLAGVGFRLEFLPDAALRLQLERALAPDATITRQ